MNSMELCNYLETVRIGRKMTQEAMLHGIVSIRTYQRYRNGTGDLPYEKLEMFAERLGIPSKKLLNEFEKEKNKQSRIINNLYNAAVNNDFENVKKITAEMSEEMIIEEDTRKLYQHSMIIYKYYLNKVSKEEALIEISNLVNYPGIIKHEFITDIEALILSSLLDFVKIDEQSSIITRLSNIYESNSGIFSPSDNSFVRTLILRRLVKSYGVSNDYSQVIKLSDVAIQNAIQIKQYYLLEYFYYYKALAYFRLEDFSKFEENLFKCYSVLHMEGNHKKIEKFTSWIEKDFRVNFDMFVLRHLQKKVK